MATVNELSRKNRKPPVLPGASMLAPMDASEPVHEQQTTPTKNGKAKGNRNAKGRFGVLNGFVDCSLPGLSRSEVMTWLVLFRDTRDGTARTSQADIARRAGLSDRSVRTAIGKLTKAGLLFVVYRGGLNQGPSRYRVEPLRKLAS